MICKHTHVLTTEHNRRAVLRLKKKQRKKWQKQADLTGRRSRYLKQLSVGQRLTQQLLCVATDNEQRGHDGHQHPGEDEREAHPPGRRGQDGDMITHSGTEHSSTRPTQNHCTCLENVCTTNQTRAAATSSHSKVSHFDLAGQIWATG